MTYDRPLADSNTLAALVSGRMTLAMIELQAGFTVSNITFVSGGTAATSPTNQMFGIYATSGARQAVTSNGTTARGRRTPRRRWR
jgi:hypothetical protein